MLNLEYLLSRGETSRIDARSAAGAVPAVVWQIYSAFANTSGGIILLGAEKKRGAEGLFLTGIMNPEQLILQLWSGLENRNTVSANILFKNQIYRARISEADIVVMEVPRAPRINRPVFTGKDIFSGTYFRSGEDNILCSRDRIRDMLRDQKEDSGERQLLWRYGTDSLDPDTLARYRAVFGARHPKHPLLKMGDEEFLARIGAVGRNEERHLCASLAGLMFFGRREALYEVKPDFHLDYRELLPGGNGWMSRVSSKRQDWSGNIFDFYCRIIDSLTAVAKGDEPEDPLLLRRFRSCLEEMLINSFVHGDLICGTGIVLAKGEEWLTVSSPGIFLMDPDEACAGGFSEPRNPLLRSFFSLIMAGQIQGTGLVELFQVWNATNRIKPRIVESFDSNRTTFILRLKAGEAPKEEEDIGEKTDSPSVQTNDRPENVPVGKAAQLAEEGRQRLLKKRGLTQQQARAMVAYPEYPTGMDLKVYDSMFTLEGSSVKELANHLNLPHEDVDKSLHHLSQLGFLYRR
ncbi:MAG: putative DNA binding domain-containing protein [Blautia sp.]|nr:putative DNA binding domain-containing protein [Blautia sp.]